MRRLRGLTGLLLAAVALAPLQAAAASPPSPGTLAGPFGRGDAQVWLLRPRGRIRDVVVFGHGWKSAPPSPEAPWVGQFRPWLDHLLARGSAVVFPRYQLGTGDPQTVDRVRAFEAGVRTGFLRLGRPAVPFVAVGYSFGASLAFSYAANARRSGLPVPRAVLAVFPAGMIPGAPLPTPAPSLRVVILVGDEDVDAGRAGADAFWRWLSSHPAANKRYTVVRSTALLRATHSAPKLSTPAARHAFWQPLDALIAAAVSRPAG